MMFTFISKPFTKIYSQWACDPGCGRFNEDSASECASCGRSKP